MANGQMEMQKQTNMLGVAMFSAAVGAATALLFIARKPADELRAQISNKARETKQKSTDKMREFRDSFKNAYHEADSDRPMEDRMMSDMGDMKSM